MDEDHKLTKREKKELRRMEWAEKAKVEQRNAAVKKYSIWAGAILVIILTIAGLAWLVTSPSPSTSSITVPEISDKDITNGQISAKVSLIEYSDFQCPACAAYNPIVTQLLSDYKGKIYYAYRMFPLTNIHKNALISAQAGFAAYKQDKFFEMDQLLFGGQKDWSEQNDPRSIFMGYARQLKMDTSKFQADLNSDEAKNYVKESQDRATSQGINSTPTFFVNGVKIQNPPGYEAFKKIIDDQLNKK